MSRFGTILWNESKQISLTSLTNKLELPLSNAVFFISTVVPDATDADMEDERCPLVSGCDRVDGRCVCESKRSCIRTYSYPDRDTCVHAGKTGMDPVQNRFFFAFRLEHVPKFLLMKKTCMMFSLRAALLGRVLTGLCMMYL